MDEQLSGTRRGRRGRRGGVVTMRIAHPRIAHPTPALDDDAYTCDVTLVRPWRCGCAGPLLLHNAEDVQVAQCTGCGATWQHLAEQLVRVWAMLPGSQPPHRYEMGIKFDMSGLKP